MNLTVSESSNILMIGNGLLRLNGGVDWTNLLRSLNEKAEIPDDISRIPFAMQPETICGTDVESVQRKTAEVIRDGEAHPLLKELLKLPFDAVITTNYTYEIELALTDGKWNESLRKKCHTTLYGSPHVWYNAFKCNLMKCSDGRTIPVFHIHGERARKKSLVLSYYSYADSLFHIVEMNKRRRTQYMERIESKEPIDCEGWLDYFLLGNVYAVGFGFDFSEFDVWWALERKSREKSPHGKMTAYMISSSYDSAKAAMLKAMGCEEVFISPGLLGYESAYKYAVRNIRSRIAGMAKEETI